MTAAKFELLILVFSVSGFALSNVAVNRLVFCSEDVMCFL
jgi:hypothetical protein